MMRILENLCKDPFRLCFPAAIVFALYACVLWICFGLFGKGNYPGLIHAQIFIGGFLYYTIFGFLLTAIPRFTQTGFAKPWEIGAVFLHILIIFITIPIQEAYFFWFFIACGWPLLLNFGARRFLKRAQNPPPTFLFVGLGVMMGFIGSISLALFHSGILPHVFFLNLGKTLFFDSMTLSLILGVGGRLIPGILGFEEVLSLEPTSSSSEVAPFLSLISKPLFFMALLFIISAFMEAMSFDRIAYTMRSLVICYIAFNYWKLHKRPIKCTWHGIFLRISCWFLVIPNILLIFFVEQKLAIKHLIFIGGFSLITFLISGRVITAHGNEGLQNESRIFPYALVGLFFICAALTRSTANLFPIVYVSHLGYAAVWFFLGVVTWGLFFIPKILTRLKV